MLRPSNAQKSASSFGSAAFPKTRLAPRNVSRETLAQGQPGRGRKLLRGGPEGAASRAGAARKGRQPWVQGERERVQGTRSQPHAVIASVDCHTGKAQANPKNAAAAAAAGTGAIATAAAAATADAGATAGGAYANLPVVVTTKRPFCTPLVPRMRFAMSCTRPVSPRSTMTSKHMCASMCTCMEDTMFSK